jgi:hypothetical protein
MGFPPKEFYSVGDLSVRWEVAPLQIIEWAMNGRVELIVALPHAEFEGGEEADYAAIRAGHARPLFRSYGDAERHVFIRRARPPSCSKMLAIVSPPDGVKIMAADVLVATAEVERFEDENGLVRRVVSGPGAQTRYDWDGFYCEIICRVHDNGLPEKQKDLIDDMVEWFLGRSVNGDAPDPSTIRKKIRGFWGRLRPE